MASREDSITEYRQALLGLNEVNEPQITFLTILAMQHAEHAYDIVCAIETHIEMVNPHAKLPAIYLIDSIVRNLPQSPYKFLLKNNIVHTFTSVFEKVDRTTRQALFNVRQSWVGVFPNNKLYSLDWKINTHLDPSWPITAIAPEHGSSHVDPRCPQLRQQMRDIGLSCMLMIPKYIGCCLLFIDHECFLKSLLPVYHTCLDETAIGIGCNIKALTVFSLPSKLMGYNSFFKKKNVDMRISSLNIYFLRKEMMIIIIITAIVLVIIQQS
ncbi:hypothetical protein ACJMK2_000822 [Sinanodonta woodiana]|uniref:CID domain-containing protein n=1 Tax=Sinanodonta woodiana TaxID=1069815 RepID=A0ABD3XQL3_SINWO